MELRLATFTAVDYACNEFHYAKRTPLKAIAFNVYNSNKEWCGVIVYGYGANKSIAEIYDKWQGQVLELVRVALNGKQESTSQALGISLRLLKKYCPMVDMVVSYADLDQEHTGIIYQATNWIYTGETTGGQRVGVIVNGKQVHNRSIPSRGWKSNIDWIRAFVDKDAEVFITKGKHKYLYCFDKKLRKRVLKEQQPYPK